MGGQSQIELENYAKKNSISFDKSKTVYQILNQDYQLESKKELKKFVSDVSQTKSKKKIEEVAFVIVWECQN